MRSFFAVVMLVIAAAVNAQVTTSSMSGKVVDQSLSLIHICFGMVAGLALGIYIYPYWNFHHVVYTCVALGTLALLLILAVDRCV